MVPACKPANDMDPDCQRQAPHAAQTVQGLGFPQLSNMRTLPVFFNMMTQGLLDAPTFSIYLNPDPVAEPAGEVQFGGMNNARFLGSVNWTPVVEKS